MKMYPSTISSRRWRPTPEQVMILEKMYIGGIRTPKAVQIEAITAHLSHYGKIEGKNVFYWFQNHKARDRQKLRKKLMMSKQIHHQHQQLKYQNQQSPQFFYYIPDPVEVPTQAGIMNALPHSISSRKVDLLTPDQQSVDVDKTIAKMDDHDWPVVLDVAPTKNKPLETLELFPTTPTDHGLKNECTTDYKPNHPVNL